MDEKLLYTSLSRLIKKTKFAIIFEIVGIIILAFLLNFWTYLFGVSIKTLVIPVTIGGLAFVCALLIVDILDYRFYSKHLKRIKEEENL